MVGGGRWYPPYGQFRSGGGRFARPGGGVVNGAECSGAGGSSFSGDNVTLSRESASAECSVVDGDSLDPVGVGCKGTPALPSNVGPSSCAASLTISPASDALSVLNLTLSDTKQRRLQPVFVDDAPSRTGSNMDSDGLLNVDSVVMPFPAGVSSDTMTQDPFPLVINSCTSDVCGIAPSTVLLDVRPASRSPVWGKTAFEVFDQVECIQDFSLDGFTVFMDDSLVEEKVLQLNCAVVGKLLGRKLQFKYLDSELRRQWQGFGDFRLLLLSSDCFLCIFQTLEARDSVLQGGPWFIDGFVVAIDAWSLSFDPHAGCALTTPVWIRLPGLPLLYWDKKNLGRIATMIGTPLWLDSITSNWESSAYARLCIKLDLSKMPPTGVWIRSKYHHFCQPIEYEGITSLCFKCGFVGHLADSCGVAPEKPQPASSAVDLVMPLNPAEPPEGSISSAACSLSAGVGALDLGAPLVEAVLPAPHLMQSSVVTSSLPDTGAYLPKLDLQGAPVSLNRQPNAGLVSPSSTSSFVSPAHVDRGYGPWMLVPRRRRPARSFRQDKQRSMASSDAATSPLDDAPSPPPHAEDSPLAAVDQDVLQHKDFRRNNYRPRRPKAP